MNEIFFLCTAILFSSLVTGALVYCLTRAIKPLRDSPMLWASALISIIASSALATVFFMSPSLSPVTSLNINTLHAPLGPVEVLEWTARNVQTSSSQLKLDITKLVSLTYLIGLALFLLRLISGRRRALQVASQAKRHVSKKGIEFWVTQYGISPYVIRLFRSTHDFKIVMPESLVKELKDAQIDHILRHELAHLNRRDDEIGLALRVILAFTWFTPVTHLLFHRWSHGIEILCDHVAIRGSSIGSRRDYANTLLKTLRVAANHAEKFPVTAFSTKRLRNEKMRIKSIVEGRLLTFGSLSHKFLIIGSASCLSLASAMLLSAKAEADDCYDKKQIASESGQIMLRGQLTASYGKAPDPFIKGKVRDHKGVDIAAPAGTPIYAPQDAIIIAATDLYNDKPKYGKVVVIQTSNNTQTLLTHLDDYQVEVGQEVEAGTIIAHVGSTGASTGPHVHIETFVSGQRVDPKTIWRLAD